MQRLKMKDITLLTCRAYFKPNKITPYIANILKEEQLLKNGAKTLTDSWYLGALYLRYKVLKGIKDDTKENKGQFQSSFKEFEGKIIKD